MSEISERIEGQRPSQFWHPIYDTKPCGKYEENSGSLLGSKGQIKSKWIDEVIDFPNYQQKYCKNFCPERFVVEYL